MQREGTGGELTLFTLSRVITYLPSHYLNHHECILSDYYSISAVAVEAAEIACSRRLKQKNGKDYFIVVVITAVVCAQRASS